ncbi:hypothetical protein OKA04_17390 [Luteolibacter flavescens]|uniref:Uncharacterized protein n=1 Tax=Luteolibacter flavescens TaxID=1859460 RepID=A0ABT3FSF8_9BACT|nr:hypothetical protein [Luteolibacter flavescens]MCW1886516.1 hypothetical protein [Luteolibacter flavescens]
MAGQMGRRRKLAWITGGIFTLLAAILLIDGRVVALLRFAGTAHQPSFDRDFRQLETLLPAGDPEIQEVYQGLAHPYGNKDAFVRQLWESPNRSILGYRFHEQQEMLAPDLKEKMARVLSRQDSFTPYGGPKMCGGYHADFAVKLGGDGQVRWMLVCLGCGEVLIKSDDGEVICDLSPLAEVLLSEIWSEHRGDPHKVVGTRLPVEDSALTSWGFKEYTRSSAQLLPGKKPRIPPENIRTQTILSTETVGDPRGPRFVYMLREEAFSDDDAAANRVVELNAPAGPKDNARDGTPPVRRGFAIGSQVYVISAQMKYGGAEISDMEVRLRDYLKSEPLREVMQFE